MVRTQALHGLLAELKRRKVTRVVAVYCVVGFAVVEAADIMAGALDLQAYFVRLVGALVVLGFPIAIVLAWSYDIVPDAAVKVHVATEQPAASSFRLAALLGILVLVLAVFFAYRSASDLGLPPSLAASADEMSSYSVAVMPLDNLSGDRRLDNAGLIIADTAHGNLASVAQLKVTALQSVTAMVSRNLTIPEIAAELHVSNVIDGTINVVGDNIRVSVQLIDAESGDLLDSGNFTAPLSEMSGLYAAVASQITNMVVSRLPLPVPPPAPYSAVNLGAGQDAYLDGRASLALRTPEGIRVAIESLSESVRLQPRFAPAHAELSSAYALALFYRIDVGMDGYELAARSLAAAEEALRLDQNLASGYAARGYLGALIGAASAEVAADFDRAMMLQPGLPSVPSWRARSLAQRGQIEQAVAAAKLAIELDPHTAGRHIALAGLLFSIGDYAEAIVTARAASEQEPSQYLSRAIEGRALMMSGQADACIELELGPHRVLRATCLAESGRMAEAESIVADETQSRVARPSFASFSGSYTDVVVYEDLAIYYARLGETQQSLNWIERAYRSSPVGVEQRLLNSELFAAVGQDGSFNPGVQAIRSGVYDQVRRLSERAGLNSVSPSD